MARDCAELSLSNGVVVGVGRQLGSMVGISQLIRVTSVGVIVWDRRRVWVRTVSLTGGSQPELVLLLLLVHIEARWSG